MGARGGIGPRPVEVLRPVLAEPGHSRDQSHKAVPDSYSGASHVFLLCGSFGGWFSVLKHQLVDSLTPDKLVSQGAAVPKTQK